MASGNSGSNLLSDIIYCIGKCVRDRISERDYKVQGKPLEFMYDLWIFCFWGTIGSDRASDSGMPDRDGDCCLDSGVWLIGAGLLFPQYLLYIPGWIFLMEQIWEQSMDIWKHRELFPVNKRRYLGKTGISVLLLSGGILAECYLNPWIAEKILDYLK